MIVLDALRSGFSNLTAEWHLQLLRILLGFAVCWKACTSAFLGDWHRFRRGSFDTVLLHSRIPARIVPLISRAHQPAIILRDAAGLAIAAGWHTKAAIVVAVLTAVEELAYEYRFHNLFINLSLLCLLPAGALGHGLTMSDQLSDRNTFSAVLLVLLACDLYWNGAWIKFRSKQFRSGTLLSQMLYVSHHLRPRLPRPEYWHPTWLYRWFNTSTRVPRLAAGGVLLAECAVPLLLLVPATFWLGLLLGAGLHLLLTLILPLRLIPFSVATVGSYLAFVS